MIYLGNDEPTKTKSNGLTESVSSNAIELDFSTMLSMGTALADVLDGRQSILEGYVLRDVVS
jgi:hypothetical protein